MTTKIEFGTDGWRAVIADGFTFDNVRLVSDAIAVAASGFDAPAGIERNRLIVGYDRRFLSREFAREVAATLSGAGFEVLLSAAPTPSQTISFSARARKCLGGVVVTASHNPASYNGLKFKGWYGGSALPEMYASIADSVGKQRRADGGSVTEVDLLDDYVAALAAIVDVEKIRGARLSILHDALHGVAAGLPARILGVASREGETNRSSPAIVTLRGETNPSFGGVNPEPIEENLSLSRARMREGGFDLAICNDGDADRLGILDERGEFVSPHKILSLLTLYLVRYRGIHGEVVKTFSTTRLLEKIARSLGVRLHETAIGFKYVADLMLARNIVIGGEESGGIGLGSFLPERDGILSGLLVAECIAEYGKPLSQIIDEMEAEFGRLYYGRRDLRRTMPAVERLLGSVRSGELNDSFGTAFESMEEKDGVKLNFSNGGWILFRKSGTEPLVRIYCESPEAEAVDRMLDVAVAALDRG